VQRVRQALLSAPQLERVGIETGLFKPGMTAKERQYAVEALRKRIQISASSSGNTSSVYQIAYKNRDRDKALRVVKEILDSFVEGSLGGKRAGTAQAQSFLTKQAADYLARLQAAEGKLAEFKKRNIAVVPGARGDYFARLQAESDALQRAEAALVAALNRRAALQRQMRSEQQFLSVGAQPGSRAGEAGGASMAGATAPAGDVATRIREAQAKLDELLVRFTEKHPEVVGLRQTLEELRARQAADLDAARRGDPGAAARAGLTASPVFQSIQLQYNQVEVEVASLQSDVTARRTAVAELRRMLDSAPEAEAEFAQLNREYQLARDQHQAVVERLERSRVGQGAGAALQFEVIDPPNALFDPVEPKRGILIVLVLLLGLAAGGGVAYLMQMLRPVFFSARALRQATGLPVLGAVSLTWLDRYRAEEWRAGLRYAAAVGALGFCSLLVLVAQYRIARMVRALVA
jgi:polysaccharide chain length determinant protein (PEP-CTERM system associated)